MNIKVNSNGLIGLGLVALMLIIRFLQTNGDTVLARLLGAIENPYVIISIIAYVVVLFWLTSRRESFKQFTQRYRTQEQQLNSLRVLIGAHLAFGLLTVGLLLGLNDIFVQIVYFVVAVGIAMIIPFLVISQRTISETKE